MKRLTFRPPFLRTPLYRGYTKSQKEQVRGLGNAARLHNKQLWAGGKIKVCSRNRLVLQQALHKRGLLGLELELKMQRKQNDTVAAVAADA